MNKKKLHLVFGLIICLAVLRGLIYCVAIPFDHAPDEKHHFALIKAKHLQLAHASPEKIQRDAARYELTWTLLLFPEASQAKLETEFSAEGQIPSPPPSRQLYYFVTASILHLCSLENMRDEIYLMRGFSILCGACVVGLSILIARILFPDDCFFQFSIPLFITFVPQFSAMNGVISNDKLAEVLTALLFWILCRIFKHGLSWQYGFAYGLTIGIALFSKRTTYFLLPLSLLALFLYVWKGRIGIRMHLFMLGGMLLVIGIIYGLLWFPGFYVWVDERIISIPEARELPRAIFRRELFASATLLHIAKFFVVMYWGFWGIFDYMTIHLHHFWYLAAACVQGGAIIGLGILMIQAKRRMRPVEQWCAKLYYLFGASIALSLIIPVFRSIILLFGAPDLTQGRYLFTVMIPISVLTMLGLAVVFPPKYRRWLGGFGLFALFVLDTVALSNYICLNFHYATFF